MFHVEISTEQEEITLLKIEKLNEEITKETAELRALLRK